MIKPIGSDVLQPLFVYDTDEHHALRHEAESLPSVIISSQAAGNAVMMGGGYFTPLKGFMTVGDALGCAENMKMSDGSFFRYRFSVCWRMSMQSEDISGLRCAIRMWRAIPFWR